MCVAVTWQCLHIYNLQFILDLQCTYTNFKSINLQVFYCKYQSCGCSQALWDKAIHHREQCEQTIPGHTIATHIHTQTSMHTRNTKFLFHIQLKIYLTCSTENTKNKRMLRLKIVMWQFCMHACFVIWKKKKNTQAIQTYWSREKSHNSSFHFLQAVQHKGE